MDVDQSEKEEFDDRYDYFLIVLNYILSGWSSLYNAKHFEKPYGGGIVRNILIVNIKANLHQPDKK